MKKLILVIPFLIYAETFNQIKQDITHSLTYKISKQEINLYKEKLKILNSKNYGKLDINYQAVDFLTRPYIKSDVAVASIGGRIIYKNMNINTADKFHYMGEIKYSYPIFNKLLTTSITKSKLELIKQKLNAENIKRILILKTAELYSQIYAIKQNIKALNIAKKALLISKRKAKALYKVGFLNGSNVDEINAKYYEIIANIKQLKAQRENLLQNLGYILNKKIDKIDGINIESVNNTPNFKNRVDVKIIQENLKLANQDIKIAKSNYYPEIGLEIGLKREADNLGLTQNDYSNLDKSYIALGINYNFDGSKNHQVEMAKIAKNINSLFYNDYLNKIKTEYNVDLNNKKALLYQLKSAQKEIKARESYYNYIQAKFNEGLSDSSSLSDAIAKLAQSKAKKEYIKSQIFFLTEKLKINGGGK